MVTYALSDSLQQPEIRGVILVYLGTEIVIGKWTGKVLIGTMTTFLLSFGKKMFFIQDVKPSSKVHRLLPWFLQEEIRNEDKLQRFKGEGCTYQLLEVILHSWYCFLVELVLMREDGVLVRVYQESMGVSNFRDFIHDLNVRKVCNYEPDLYCGGDLIIFDLIVKHLTRILTLLNLLDVEFATSDHSVGRRDYKLEAPIHRHESASMHQRHP